MKLYVPDIGEELTLTADWQFETICEHRNNSLFNAFGVPREMRWERLKPLAPSGYFGDHYRDGFNHYKVLDTATKFVLPAGTVLKVDRIYIRKGNGEYSSITFLIGKSSESRVATKKNGGLLSKAVRFWVKLHETRNIEIEQK